MGGLEVLLSESLVSQINKNLGANTVESIEKRLNDRYGITLIDSVRDFQKIDATLREFFGSGADEMEKDLIETFISIGGKTKEEKTWINIHDQGLSKLILESLGDPNKKLILDSSLKKPQLILDILNTCKIPKSTGYRNINELINMGLLTEKGYSLTTDGRKTVKYVTFFEKIDISIQDGKMNVRLQINEEFFRESFIIKLINNT